MPTCVPVAIPGGVALVRMHGQAGRRCRWCERPATKLCDFPVTRSGKTCDAPLCRTHAKVVGPDRDFCPDHEGG